jgi:SPP1 gp7 family putative phage head morphogenesis protein
LSHIEDNFEALTVADHERFLSDLIGSVIEGLYLTLNKYDDKFMSAEEEIVKDFIEQNTLLIKDVESKVRIDISRVVKDGIHAGESNQVIAKKINDTLEMSSSRSRTIAVTETAKVYGQLNRNRMLSKGLTRASWSSSKLKNTRKCHNARDGKTYNIEEGCYSACDGAYIQVGQEVNCRCSMVIIFD